MAMSDDSEEHPEPVDGDVEFTEDQLAQFGYVMWCHGVTNPVRARVMAELMGEEAPAWAI
jgi:hypothetical protein